MVYGETMIVDAEGKEIGLRRLKAPENLTWRSFINGMLVCHQSIYVKRELADSYNLKYKIAADYEWGIKSVEKSQEHPQFAPCSNPFSGWRHKQKNYPQRFI